MVWMIQLNFFDYEKILVNIWTKPKLEAHYKESRWPFDVFENSSSMAMNMSS